MLNKTSANKYLRLYSIKLKNTHTSKKGGNFTSDSEEEKMAEEHEVGLINGCKFSFIKEMRLALPGLESKLSKVHDFKLSLTETNPELYNLYSSLEGGSLLTHTVNCS